MKNYKFVVPILLVVLTVFSVYQLSSEKISASNEYADYLEKARSCAELGVIDASEYYSEALEIKPSVEVYLEYVNFFLSTDDFDSAKDVAENMVDAFPKSTEAYYQLLSIEADTADYSEFFSTYNETQSRKLHSASIDEIYADNEYIYYMKSKRFEDVKTISDSTYAVQNDKGFWGYVNEKGSSLVACQYKYAGPFSEDVASVCDQNDSLYYINSDGKKKFVFDVDFDYDYLGQMYDGIYAVGCNGKYSYYDMSYNKLFGDYDYAGTFFAGVAAVKDGGSWMLINEKGKVVSDKYDNILLDSADVACRNNRVVAVKDGVYYLLNESGDVVKKTEFDSLALVNSGSLIAFEDNSKWGFCDLDGDIVIEPQYSQARSFDNGLAAVCEDDKWGYINEENRLVIDCVFGDAMDFNSSGCAFVYTENEYWDIIKLYKYD